MTEIKEGRNADLFYSVLNIAITLKATLRKFLLLMFVMSCFYVKISVNFLGKKVKRKKEIKHC